MSRRHVFALVVLLGAAAVAGLLALTRTTRLGAAATTPTSAEIASKTRALDRLEASLRRQLAAQPPAIPAGATTVTAAPQRTVYVHAAAARPRTGEHEGYEGGDGYDGEHRDD